MTKQTIEELSKALGHLGKAQEDPVFIRPYESEVVSDHYPRLFLGQAIDNIRFLVKYLRQEKEETCSKP